MTKVTIFIDPTSSIHKELEKEILGYVESLESASYQRITMPSEPGKLGGIDAQTIKIIVELGTAVIEFVSAIMLIVAQVSASHEKPKDSDKKKPIEVEVAGIKISLPMKEETSRKHLRTIKIKIEKSASPSAASKRHPAKKSRG